MDHIVDKSNDGVARTIRKRFSRETQVGILIDGNLKVVNIRLESKLSRTNNSSEY